MEGNELGFFLHQEWCYEAERCIAERSKYPIFFTWSFVFFVDDVLFRIHNRKLREFPVKCELCIQICDTHSSYHLSTPHSVSRFLYKFHNFSENSRLVRCINYSASETVSVPALGAASFSVLPITPPSVFFTRFTADLR